MTAASTLAQAETAVEEGREYIHKLDVKLIRLLLNYVEHSVETREELPELYGGVSWCAELFRCAKLPRLPDMGR